MTEQLNFHFSLSSGAGQFLRSRTENFSKQVPVTKDHWEKKSMKIKEILGESDLLYWQDQDKGLFSLDYFSAGRVTIRADKEAII